MATQEKSCSRCGQAFGCGADPAGGGRCWCAQLPPIFPLPESSEKDCLCPGCLRAEASARVGKCLDCRHAQALRTKGGSAVFLCGRSGEAAGYAKYPRLPMLDCAGHERR